MFGLPLQGPNVEDVNLEEGVILAKDVLNQSPIVASTIVVRP